jgi:molybdate transport system regulatory protein
MGPGKAELLEAIDATGSISAAARQMHMSYRRAWLLVQTMNECFAEPLVESVKGGEHGGGAALTAAGIAALEAYRAIARRAEETFRPLLAKSERQRPRRSSDGPKK